MSRYSLVIGNKNYSSWSLRPWLVMKQANIDFEETVVPLYLDGSKTDLLKHSPAGKVPVLKTGDDILWDSLAICEYLNDVFPDANLWPQDVIARAHARSISNEMHSGFFNVRNDLPMNMRKFFPGFKISAECQNEVARIDDIWVQCRKRFGQQGDFLFGDFTIADAMFAPVVSRFTTYDIEVSAPAKDYMQTIMALPALQAWMQAATDEPWVLEIAEV